MKEIFVRLEEVDGKANISVGQRAGQEKVSILEMTGMLIGGLSLLINLSEEASGIKDYVMMQAAVDMLNQMFASSEGFKNTMITTDYKKDKE